MILRQAQHGIQFEPFRARDALNIQLQHSQWVEAGIEARGMTIEQARDLEGSAWTAWRMGPGLNMRILCCAGFRELFPGRHAIAWALLAAGIGPRALLTVTRFARARIAESPLVRIECLTRDGRAERRWAEAVGLAFRAALPGWGAASETICVFDRVKLVGDGVPGGEG